MSNDKPFTICACGHPVTEHDGGGCNHLMDNGYQTYCPCVTSVQWLAFNAERRLSELEKLVEKLETMEGITHE